MDSIQLRGGQNRDVFTGSDCVLWVEEGTGGRASWAQREEGPSCGPSGWPWVQAFKALLKDHGPVASSLCGLHERRLLGSHGEERQKKSPQGAEPWGPHNRKHLQSAHPSLSPGSRSLSETDL